MTKELYNNIGLRYIYYTTEELLKENKSEEQYLAFINIPAFRNIINTEVDNNKCYELFITYVFSKENSINLTPTNGQNIYISFIEKSIIIIKKDDGKYYIQREVETKKTDEVLETITKNFNTIGENIITFKNDIDDKQKDLNIQFQINNINTDIETIKQKIKNHNKDITTYNNLQNVKLTSMVETTDNNKQLSELKSSIITNYNVTINLINDKKYNMLLNNVVDIMFNQIDYEKAFVDNQEDIKELILEEEEKKKAQRIAEEEQRQRKLAEVQRIAEEQRKAEEEAKRIAEEEAKRKAEEEQRKAEEEAKRIAEEEAKRKAEEAKRKAEEEQRKAEEEAKRIAEEEERQRKLAEIQRKAEEAKRQAEEEQRKAEEAKRQAEEAKRQAEEEAKRIAEEYRQNYENQKNRLTNMIDNFNLYVLNDYQDVYNIYTREFDEYLSLKLLDDEYAKDIKCRISNLTYETDDSNFTNINGILNEIKEKIKLAQKPFEILKSLLINKHINLNYSQPIAPQQHDLINIQKIDSNYYSSNDTNKQIINNFIQKINKKYFTDTLIYIKKYFEMADDNYFNEKYGLFNNIEKQELTYDILKQLLTKDFVILNGSKDNYNNYNNLTLPYCDFIIKYKVKPNSYIITNQKYTSFIFEDMKNSPDYKYNVFTHLKKYLADCNKTIENFSNIIKYNQLYYRCFNVLIENIDVLRKFIKDNSIDKLNNSTINNYYSIINYLSEYDLMEDGDEICRNFNVITSNITWSYMILNNFLNCVGDKVFTECETDFQILESKYILNFVDWLYKDKIYEINDKKYKIIFSSSSNRSNKKPFKLDYEYFVCEEQSTNKLFTLSPNDLEKDKNFKERINEISDYAKLTFKEPIIIDEEVKKYCDLILKYSNYVINLVTDDNIYKLIYIHYMFGSFTNTFIDTENAKARIDKFDINHYFDKKATIEENLTYINNQINAEQTKKLKDIETSQDWKEQKEEKEKDIMKIFTEKKEKLANLTTLIENSFKKDFDENMSTYEVGYLIYETLNEIKVSIDKLESIPSTLKTLLNSECEYYEYYLNLKPCLQNYKDQYIKILHNVFNLNKGSETAEYKRLGDIIRGTNISSLCILNIIEQYHKFLDFNNYCYENGLIIKEEYDKNNEFIIHKINKYIDYFSNFIENKTPDKEKIITFANDYINKLKKHLNTEIFIYEKGLNNYNSEYIDNKLIYKIETGLNDHVTNLINELDEKEDDLNYIINNCIKVENIIYNDLNLVSKTDVFLDNIENKIKDYIFINFKINDYKTLAITKYYISFEELDSEINNIIKIYDKFIRGYNKDGNLAVVALNFFLYQLNNYYVGDFENYLKNKYHFNESSCKKITLDDKIFNIVVNPSMSSDLGYISSSSYTFEPIFNNQFKYEDFFIKNISEEFITDIENNPYQNAFNYLYQKIVANENIGFNINFANYIYNYLIDKMKENKLKYMEEDNKIFIKIISEVYSIDTETDLKGGAGEKLYFKENYNLVKYINLFLTPDERKKFIKYIRDYKVKDLNLLTYKLKLYDKKLEDKIECLKIYFKLLN